MAPYIRKRTILLGAVVLACTAQAALETPSRGGQISSAPAQDGSETARLTHSGPSAGRPATPDEQVPVFESFAKAGEPNSMQTAAGRSNTKELFFKMMLSVTVVIALAAGALYASKRLLGRLTNLTGKRIRVLETVYLGPRKAVHLLDLDGRRFLIGSTNETITRIAELTAGPHKPEMVCGEGVDYAPPNTTNDGLASPGQMWSLEGSSLSEQTRQAQEVPAPQVQSN